MAFVADTTDWYEWVENEMRTFLQRIKAAIDADSTMQAAYAPTVVLQLTGEPRRYDSNAAFDKCLILLHSPEQAAPEPRGTGRDNIAMTATLTIHTRSAKGVSSDAEVQLVGDGTASQPSVLEVVEDLEALLHENLLVSGGEPYIWLMELGEAAPDDEATDEQHADVVRASFTLTGHKWRYTWS